VAGRFLPEWAGSATLLKTTFGTNNDFGTILYLKLKTDKCFIKFIRQNTF
jgi:hypothetical protein